MVRFINLTPHPIHLIGDNGVSVTFAESGQVARVSIQKQKNNVAVEIGEGIHLNMETQEVEHVEVINLPEPKAGVVYLVSSYVAQFVKRPDVMCPNTDGTAIRDKGERILGVKGFQVFK